DGFRVAVASELVPAAFEFLAQFAEVVDFAVENRPDRPVFVKDRLMPACRIDDAQAPHSQAAAALCEHAFIVRATVHHRLAHAADCFRIDALAPRDNSSDSAHGLGLGNHFRTTDWCVAHFTLATGFKKVIAERARIPLAAVAGG